MYVHSVVGLYIFLSTKLCDSKATTLTKTPIKQPVFFVCCHYCFSCGRTFLVV